MRKIGTFKGRMNEFKEKAGFIKSVNKYLLHVLKECIYVVSKHTPYMY